MAAGDPVVAIFAERLAFELAAEALLNLLADVYKAIEEEHGAKPWHETCPTCEVYERIHKVLVKRALA